MGAPGPGGGGAGEAKDLKSPPVDLCLATGSLVEEVELLGDRLHYSLLTGTGPQTGWVSTRVANRELLVPQEQSGVAQQSYVVLSDRVGVRDAPSTQSKLWTVLRKGERVSGMPLKVGALPWLRLSPNALRRLVQRRDVEFGHDCAWVLIDASQTDLGHGVLLRPLSEERPGADANDTSEVAFRVCSLSGELCTLAASCFCPLRDLQVAIEALTGVPSREQRLLHGAVELTSASSLQRFMHHEGDVELTLVRRPEEQAVWIEKVAKSWHALSTAPEKIRGDRDVVTLAVKQNGEMLKHASPELQADRELVLAALEKDGNTLRYAAERLRGDPEIVLAAVRSRGSALKHAPADFRADSDIVMAAVRQDWRALQWAAPICQAEPAIVLEAIRQDRDALEVAAEEAWTDPRVVVAAVKLIGRTPICPRGHPLRRVTTRFSEVECNECERQIGGDTCLCCRKCDYDVCDSCARRAGNLLVEDYGEE